MTLPSSGNISLVDILTEFGFAQVTFTSPGSSNTEAPGGTRLVLAEMWGAGGGGAAGAQAGTITGEVISGDGGGGGGYVCYVFDSAVIGSISDVNYAVGAGGLGQPSPNQGSFTPPGPRAGSGGSSGVTINGVSRFAGGGEGGVSWLTGSSPNFSFNSEPGDGGDPGDGNPGEPGGDDSLIPNGGAALSSDYSVNGTGTFYGSRSYGKGGNGFTANSSAPFWIPGEDGASGGVRLTFIGNVAAENLRSYFRGASFVPDASPNTGIPISGDIEIRDFLGAALNIQCAVEPLLVSNNPSSRSVSPPENFSITASVTGGIPPYTYNWTDNSAFVTLTNTASPTVNVAVSSGASNFQVTCTVSDNSSQIVSATTSVTVGGGGGGGGGGGPFDPGPGGGGPIP